MFVRKLVVTGAAFLCCQMLFILIPYISVPNYYHRQLTSQDIYNKPLYFIFLKNKVEDHVCLVNSLKYE